MNKGPWTDQENERLKTFVAQGVSIIRAAAVFNRTTGSIRAEARKLATPFPADAGASEAMGGYAFALAVKPPLVGGQSPALSCRD